MNFARILAHSADLGPLKPALHFLGDTLRYVELWRRVERATAMLAQRGTARGDRVAYLGYNHYDFLVLLFALGRLGAMLVPLNTRLTPAEHGHIIEDSAPRLLFSDAAFAARARGLAAPCVPLEELAGGRAGSSFDPVDDGSLPLLLVYTSGTTGAPKGAVLTHDNLLWNAINSVRTHDMTSDDHVLAFLPMFHVGGLCIQVLPALYAGASVTLMPRFEPDQVLRTLAAARPTLTLTVPATLRALQKHARWAETDLSSLKLIMTGSMNTPDSLIQACHARGVPVGQVYGSTETAPVAICLGREDALAHVGSTGKPVAHVEVRLVTADGREADSGEPGEVWVRGPNVMKEYWRAPEATRANFVDGWFRTGDVARRDDAGFYTICGRTREVIISGGENIYPAELENVLLDSPAIAEAAVIGMPDPQWGEAPVACVVRAGGAAIDEAQVMALFSGRIARYKHPRRIVFVDALPRTALGKVQRGVLRAQLDALDGGADSGRNASPAAGSNGAP